MKLCAKGNPGAALYQGARVKNFLWLTFISAIVLLVSVQKMCTKIYETGK
jgi:hypothetical protein